MVQSNNNLKSKSKVTVGKRGLFRSETSESISSTTTTTTSASRSRLARSGSTDRLATSKSFFKFTSSRTCLEHSEQPSSASPRYSRPSTSAPPYLPLLSVPTCNQKSTLTCLVFGTNTSESLVVRYIASTMLCPNGDPLDLRSPVKCAHPRFVLTSLSMQNNSECRAKISDAYASSCHAEVCLSTCKRLAVALRRCRLCLPRKLRLSRSGAHPRYLRRKFRRTRVWKNKGR